MRLAALLLLSFLASCGVNASQAGAISAEHIPPRLSREFRGAWIGVVSEDRWPSKPGLPVAVQKEELHVLLDLAASLKLNAIFLQVRPACDAIYDSAYEPWTEFLNGQMGKAPVPYYDPLKFAIQEAHARGIELHAWFNPYRAGFASTKHITPSHVRKSTPGLVRSYGKYFWLDPAEKAVQDHTVRVILDVVRRYDIDGVHLDDYFYPYPDAGDFPDNSSWQRYRAAGGSLSRNDWRRDNVNKLVHRLHDEISRRKAYLTFGISPFGIWRPGFPPEVKGFDAYEGLYADARMWLAKGWVDYMSPQLYWPINSREQSFPSLLNWWQGQSDSRPVWPGGSIALARRHGPDEIVKQIELTRKLPQPGYVHWNLSTLAKDTALQQKLRALYREPALVPVNPGDGGTVIKPTVTTEKRSGGQQLVQWNVPAKQTVSAWILQTKRGGRWETEILPATTRSRVINTADTPVIAVSAVSRFRNLSPIALVPF